MNNEKMCNYFASLSLPELLRVAMGCQKRYEEGKPCSECYLFKQKKCDGKRVISEEEDEEK